MILMLCLAALAGLGVLALERRIRAVAALAAALFLLEATAAPLTLNRTFADRPYRKPPAITLAPTPPIYRAVAGLPASAMLVEFPFGAPAFGVRYMYCSIRHGRRLVNGFSGGAPQSYGHRRDALVWPLDGAVISSGATHAVVHEWAWRQRNGRKVSRWLEGMGARRLAAEGEDMLYALPEGGPWSKTKPSRSSAPGAGSTPR